MKTIALKIAVLSTVVALFSVMFFSHINIQPKYLLVSVLHNNEAIQGALDTNIFPETIHQQEIVKDVFPDIENISIEEVYDNNFVEEENLVKEISCPFSRDENDNIIDFTKNGTVPVSALYIYADKDDLDAERTIDNLYFQAGLYTAQFASYYDSGNKNIKEGHTLEQQWYLELINDSDELIYTTKSTSDIKIDEVSTIELVERSMLLSETVVSARAVHSAFKDSEEQIIAPICVSLTKIGLIKDSVHKEIIVLPPSNNHIFTATTLLQNTDSGSNSLRFQFTISMIFILLFSIGVMTSFTFFCSESKVKDRINKQM